MKRLNDRSIKWYSLVGKALSIVAVIFLLASCDEYLDVKPKSEIEKEVLFSTEYGFFEALNGVYVRCTDEKFTSGEFLYGDELTFGILDALAQNYSIISSDISYADRYREIVNYDYESDEFITRRDEIWSGLYNAIGNSNLILQNIEENKDVFTDESYYGLIKGEALGLRAYLHFDLLRMYAPSFITNPEAPAIPYVTKFDKEVPPQYTVSQVLDRIVDDLLAAKELLATADPIVNGEYIVGYPFDDNDDGTPDDESTEESDVNIFTQNRRHRLNYFAVCGTLARVYLYQGEKEKALENALELINSGVFPWTEKEDFTADDDEVKDRILYKELIFAWSIPEMEDDLEDRFSDVNSSTLIIKTEGDNIYELGSVGAEDFRYKEWLTENNTGVANVLLVEKYSRADEDNRHPLVAPAIRLSEMYYIAAESVFESDPEQAWEYFNTVRFNRGIGTEIHDELEYEFFITELIKEARKEFYGEGQIFYMYKRLNRNIVGHSGEIISASDNIFVWPLPDDEIAFGDRD